MTDTPGRIPADARDWLALFSLPGIGATRFLQLVSAFGSPRAALEASPEEWAALPGFSKKTAAALRAGPKNKYVDNQLRALEKHGASMAVFGARDYPPLLARIIGAPPFFFYFGDFIDADERAVAVIGSRTPTPYGKKMVSTLVEELAQTGLTIVSGLAHGVDGAAHWAALKAGGRTIAVLGSGLDIIYPREHRDLVAKIRESGMILSEFPFGSAPARENFPKRNRIISGLALGAIIIEAREISGALSTARHALEQNREVFAVPGPASSELSAGTNNLIKAGAQLVTTAADILAVLGMQQKPQMKETLPLPSLSPIQQKVYQRLSETPCHIDQLGVDLALTVGELSAILLDLELLGVVGQGAGKQFHKIR
jgi:DNA processing protein